MKVLEVVEMLLKLPPDQEIIFGYWTEEFPREAYWVEGIPLTKHKEIWERTCATCDYELDWYDINRQILDKYEEYAKELEDTE